MMSNNPTIVRKWVFIAEPRTDHSFGWPCSLFSFGLIPIKKLFILMRYHLVQVLDEIRHLGLHEPLVPTLLGVCDPSYESHLPWHKEIIETDTNSWRWSCEGSAWSFPNSRAGITANCAATAAAQLKLSDLFFNRPQVILHHLSGIFFVLEPIHYLTFCRLTGLLLVPEAILAVIVLSMSL